MLTGTPEEIELVTQRLDFLDHLSTHRREKPQLVEELDHSRSTVDRAIRKLTDAGFVTRTDGGYTTTVTGRLAVERYQQFRQEQHDILSAGPLLEQLPGDCDLPVEAVAGATTETGDGVYWLFEQVAPLIRTADRYRVVLPQVDDSRHLRLCQARAEQTGLDVSILAAPDALVGLREEFPHLSTSLAETVAIHSVETPPYGLALVERGEDVTALVVVYGAEGPAGILETETEDGVEWAREQFAALQTEARDAADELQNIETGHSIQPLAADDRLAPRLRSQGFSRIDESFFENRQAMEPTTGWRAGLGVPEVAAGYAVERDGEDGPLTESLLEQLRDGEDIALLGPAGAGKSTVCKQVAYRWFEADHGPVLYREGGAGQPFDAIGELETTLQAADGHTLVVVEDAVRSDANTIFEVMQALSGRSDVSFLLDARESEYHDPETHPIDARLAAFRQEAIQTVSMPALSEDECDRVADQYEDVTGNTLETSASDLLADIERRDGDAASGNAFLLFHRLARYGDPLGETQVPTTLDDDVAQTRRHLTEAGETTLDVGVLVNALNAAGRPITPGVVHALAAERPGVSHDDIEAALSALHSRVLFPADDGSYRAVHEMWSVRFLEQLLDSNDERARERFGSVLTDVLALADDPEARLDVAETVTQSAADAGTPSATDTVTPSMADTGLLGDATRSAEWVEETVTALFRLGVDYPKLAPLYGSIDDDTITFPAAVPPSVRLQCEVWRGRMWLGAGAQSIAAETFHRIDQLAEQWAVSESGRWRFESLLGQSEAIRERGETTVARRLGRTSRTLAAELDDQQAVADSELALARTALVTSDFETAQDHLDAALERYQAVGARRSVAAVWLERGRIQLQQSNYDGAAEAFEESRTRFEQVGDVRGQADALKQRGRVAHERGNPERATAAYQQALERTRETGDQVTQAEVLKQLGNVAYDHQQDIDAAKRYYEKGLAVAEGTDAAEVLAALYTNRGNIAKHEGELDRAIEYHRDALAMEHRTGCKLGQAQSHCGLSMLTHSAGEVDESATHAEKALQCATLVGAPRVVIQARYCKGFVTSYLGDPQQARGIVEPAVELAREIENPHLESDVLGLLADIERKAGAFEAAEQHVEAVQQLEAELGRDTGGASYRGQLALARGNLAQARSSLEAAVEAFQEFDDREGLVKVHVVQARVERLDGDYEQAAAYLQQAFDILDTDGYPTERQRAICERGALARDRGDTERARTVLTEAIETSADVQDAYTKARALLERGRLERTVGNFQAAVDDLQTALEIYERGDSEHRIDAVLEALIAVAEASEQETSATDYRERRQEITGD